MHNTVDPVSNYGVKTGMAGDAASLLPLPGFEGYGAPDILLSRNAHYSRHSDQDVLTWLDDRRRGSNLKVTTTPLRRLERWHIDPASGDICHDTGRFYTVTGVKVRHRYPGGEIEWDQPIIDQPEVGILGILTQRIGGVLHFCLQAKEEPGNLGAVQLSPTVQATYSNYSRAHGGALPPFVELFLDPPRERLLFARLQSEDGGRFLFKANRNMIVMAAETDAIDLPEGFIWLTLRQIALLLCQDNLLHATTRSVLTALLFPHVVQWGERCMGWRGECRAVTHRNEDAGSLSDTLQWLDDQKAANHILVKREGLNSLQEWGMDTDGFFAHRDRRFFRIIGLDVMSDGREVSAWSQPILDNLETGIIGLLVRESEGRRFFLMQAKVEAGNRNIVQLGPTVQFTPGNYCGNDKLVKPFMFDEFCGTGNFRVLRESWQAEEGARFYHEEHLHRILLLPDGESCTLPPDFRWLSEEQVRYFLHCGETVNSCARSILSGLL
jgi:oxidase EvaA